jgi:hypothetical protein
MGEWCSLDSREGREEEVISRWDYYEHHESKEALAEGQMPVEQEVDFTCPISGAVLSKVCKFYHEVSTKSLEYHGYIVDMECRKGCFNEKGCPYAKKG